MRDGRGEERERERERERDYGSEELIEFPFNLKPARRYDFFSRSSGRLCSLSSFMGEWIIRC